MAVDVGVNSGYIERKRTVSGEGGGRRVDGKLWITLKMTCEFDDETNITLYL